MFHVTTPFVKTPGAPPLGAQSASRSRRRATWLVSALVFLLLPPESGLTGQIPPRKVTPAPETKVDGVEEILHGVKVADPYRWLEK